MQKNIKQLLLSLLIIIALVSVFLWREIVSFRSITTEVATEPLFADRPTPLKISIDDQILGNPGAPLTIVFYADLNDFKTRQMIGTFAEFVIQRPKDARLVFKHAPVSGIFSDKTLPNITAYCAGKQNKLWQYLQNIENAKNVRESSLRAAASAAGLRADIWWSCSQEEKSKSAVQKDMTEAQSLQQGRPPLIFINNKKLSTREDFDLKELLKTLISE